MTQAIATTEATLKPCAVVTGGASGIGWDVAQTLSQQGWQVWILDRQKSCAVKPALSANPELRYIECNVSDPDGVRVALQEVGRATDQVQALICSAGVHRAGRLTNHTPETFDLVMDVNVKGAWLTVKEAQSLLIQGASPERPARVVLVGSISAIRPKAGAGLYAASKAALHVMAGVLAVELAEDSILVNVVAPGTVRTPMTEIVPESEALFRQSGVSPLGRIADPQDVTRVIEFFLSDASRYVTGTVLPVDGGTRAAFRNT